MTAADTFREVVAALEATGIPFMLTGSFASSYHGAPRATQDIDLVVAPTASQLQALVSRFPAPEYYVDEEAALEALATEGQFNILVLESGWKVDVIIRKSRPFSRLEFDRRELAVVQGISLGIATVEDIILAKLEWAKLEGSERQLEDVATLLHLRAADLDYSYLRTWTPALGVEAQWQAAMTRARQSPI